MCLVFAMRCFTFPVWPVSRNIPFIQFLEKFISLCIAFRVGALTVQVSVVEAIGLGLASNPLGVCIFFGKDLVLEVTLDLVDPAGVLAYQGQ